jgi:hypothetical protein
VSDWRVRSFLRLHSDTHFTGEVLILSLYYGMCETSMRQLHGWD